MSRACNVVASSEYLVQGPMNLDKYLVFNEIRLNCRRLHPEQGTFRVPGTFHEMVKRLTLENPPRQTLQGQDRGEP